MIFKDAIDLLIGRIPSMKTDTDTDRQKAKSVFNIANSEVYRAANWEFRKRTGQVIVIPNYTTGTCSYTQYDGTNEATARQVAFAGSALTQAMIGRYFQPNKSSQWYKIIYISGSTAYLDTPVVETTASGKAFTIWKRFYYLKSEVDIVTDFGNWERNDNLQFFPSTGLTDSVGNLSSTGNPMDYSPYGVDPFDDKVYTDGTISIPQDSNVVTGAGTAFLANADSGDILVVNSKEYTIKRVETDTQMILQNYADSQVEPNTVYKIRKNNPIGFQFFYSTDQYRILHYEYLDRAYPLVNENFDFFHMPYEYLEAVLTRAESLIRKDKDDPKWVAVLALYQSELEGLKLKKNAVEPRFMQFAPKIPSFMPGRS